MHISSKVEVRELTWEWRQVFVVFFENKGTKRRGMGRQELAFLAQGKWAEVGAQKDQILSKV